MPPEPTPSVELAGWVALEGCFNFRDLGSYVSRSGARMRGGQVFRADGLQRLSETDLDRLCGELGLAHVIDLRSEDEIAEDGTGAIAERATIHRIPLFDRTRSRAAGGENAVPREFLANMGQLYYMMLTAARVPIARVVSLIAELDAPAVFHCAAGKDRTGVISAVILSLLDVPEETIVADYAFSRQNIDQINARLAESPTYQRLMNDLPEGAYDADPAAMEYFLGRIHDEQGGVEGWAEASGIDAERIAMLRKKLLS